MFVKPFRYHKVVSVSEAAEMLRAGDGAARVIAGGQSLLPMLNLGVVEFSDIVDISNIPGLSTIEEQETYLNIGSLVTHRELEINSVVAARQPLVGEAAKWIGNRRVRFRGTLGGSLAHSDPSAELPLVMVTLGAEYEVSDGRACRSLRADEFHISHFTTSLKGGEVITQCRIPILEPDWGWGFREVARRKGDFAIVAAAALVRVDGDEIVESRLALGGVGERPFRHGASESALTGATPSDLSTRIGPFDDIEPLADTNATADYRRHIAPVLALKALEDAYTRAQESQ